MRKSSTIKEINFKRPDAVRGKYAQRDPNIPKTKITIWLDNDVLEYFKRRAEPPTAAPYQTEINNALRAVMEGDKPAGVPLPLDVLVNNEQFIAAVAAKVAERTVQAR